MEDYEINILRRDGNWKKVKPNDLIIDEIDNELLEHSALDNNTSQKDFVSYVSKLDKIIIDTIEVIKAAKTKWNIAPFYPGLVGGHCIGIDP